MPIVGRLRCSSWRPTAIVASPMTVVATAARANLGPATTWIPTPMTSRLSWIRSISNARFWSGSPRVVAKSPAISVATARNAWPQFYKDLASGPFFGFNRPGAKISQGMIDWFWVQGMQAGHKNTFDCIKAFSETDFTEDLKKFDVPTLIVHGDDDQVVPIGAAALASSKLVKNATLKVYAGAPHGLTETHKEQLNADLLAFLKA